jgi:hypothetical protein
LPTGDAACWRTSAYLGVLAPLVIVGARLRDELLEKTEVYRTFRHPGRQDVRRWAATPKIRVRSAKCCLASRYLRKISTAWHASTARACQDAGFHATFSLTAALCDAVWPN